MSTEQATNQVIRTALWKGCLGGLAMVVLYLTLGLAAYFLLSQTNLSQGMIWLISILIGPVVGNASLLLTLYLRASRPHRNGPS